MKASESIPEPAPFEKFNWLIHLQHVRGETEACKQLIRKELERSHGKNEYALYKEVNFNSHIKNLNIYLVYF